MKKYNLIENIYKNLYPRNLVIELDQKIPEKTDEKTFISVSNFFLFNTDRIYRHKGIIFKAVADMLEDVT